MDYGERSKREMMAAVQKAFEEAVVLDELLEDSCVILNGVFALLSSYSEEPPPGILKGLVHVWNLSKDRH